MEGHENTRGWGYFEQAKIGYVNEETLKSGKAQSDIEGVLMQSHEEGRDVAMVLTDYIPRILLELGINATQIQSQHLFLSISRQHNPMREVVVTCMRQNPEIVTAITDDFENKAKQGFTVLIYKGFPFGEITGEDIVTLQKHAVRVLSFQYFSGKDWNAGEFVGTMFEGEKFKKTFQPLLEKFSVIHEKKKESAKEDEFSVPVLVLPESTDYPIFIFWAWMTKAWVMM